MAGGRVKTSCQVCQVDFETWRNWAARGQGKYCSYKCAGLGRLKRPKTLIVADCLECGRAFSYRKGRGGTGQYCSVQCKAIVNGRNHSREKHPRWKGGTSKRSYVVRRAIAERKKAIKTCEECGVAGILQGHHILEHANYLEYRSLEDNIMILCIPCHAKQHPDLESFILSRAA